MSAAWAGDAGGAARVMAATVPVAARQSAPAAVNTVTLRERRAEHNHGSWRAKGAFYRTRAHTARALLHPLPAEAPFQAMSL